MADLVALLEEDIALAESVTERANALADLALLVVYDQEVSG